MGTGDLIGIVACAALFVAFGLLYRGRGGGACGGSCGACGDKPPERCRSEVDHA